MKLILTESQYNRIFNNKKRKLVITESQYRILLNEASSNMLLSIEKGETLQLVDKSDNKLHFKVIIKSGNEIIMINCNDGVYKNAYFYINANSLKGSDLSYQIAQNDKIPEGKNPWETIGDKNIWRNSTFKDIKGFDVFKGGSEGLSCNLDKSAKKKFSLDIETGEVTKPEDKPEEEGGDDPKGKLLTAINYVKAFTKDYYYTIELADVESKLKDESGPKDGEREFVIKDKGGLNVQVLNKSNKKIDLELIEVYGGPGSAYEHLVGKVISINYTDKNIIDVNEGIKELIFDLKAYSFTKDEEGNRVEEEEMISGITNIERKGKVGEEDKEEDEGFSSSEIHALMSGDTVMKELIQNNPGAFLDFFGLVRKRGIIPSAEIFKKWGATPNNDAVLSRFKKDTTVKIKFIGKVEKSKDGNSSLLKEIVDGLKGQGNETNIKVSRNYNGETYLKLNGVINKIKYTLRVPGDSDGQDDKYKVTIVVKDGSTNKNMELGKVEIKVLDYDISK